MDIKIEDGIIYHMAEKSLWEVTSPIFCGCPLDQQFSLSASLPFAPFLSGSSLNILLPLPFIIRLPPPISRYARHHNVVKCEKY